MTTSASAGTSVARGTHVNPRVERDRHQTTMNAVLVQPMKRSTIVLGLLALEVYAIAVLVIPQGIARPPGTVDWPDVAGESALALLVLGWLVALLLAPLRSAVFLPGALGTLLLFAASIEDVLDEFLVYANSEMSLVENGAKVAGVVFLSWAVSVWHRERQSERQTLKADWQHYARLSERDALTDLYNRGTIVRRLERSLERGEQGTLLLLDIDDFKSLNDIHGHLAGDEVLRGLAETLQRQVRGSDLCGRYGGEEFVVYLTNAPDHVVQRVAEKVRTAFASTRFVVNDATLGRTVSIGVARATADDTACQLIQRADAAMYRAKHSGKNRVVYDTPFDTPPKKLTPG